MARIDHILRMIVKQGGTRLELVPNEQPQLFHGEEPLRFFLPPMGAGLVRDLLISALDPPQRPAFEAGDTLRVEYQVPESGDFTLELRGGDALRMVAHRHPPSEDEPEPAAAPAPGARPRGRAVSTDALGRMLGQALQAGASDLHLSDGEPPRMRVDGRLVILPGADVVQGLELMLGGMMDRDRQAKLVTGASVDLAVDVAGEGRVRGSVFRHRGGLAAAFRVIARAAPALDRLDLGVDLTALTRLTHGLVIVSGPTGAGKSTTLAALAAAALARTGGVLLTLEDPVEYVFEPPPGGLVRQRAVGEDVPDFATGLRDALRADPDYLLVGEMRDPESISLALTAAETGHVVYSTLHAGSAASAVERIVDAYPAERQRQIRVQLADSLRAVVAQRLLPRRDGQGRIAACEVLRNTHAVSGLIREGRTAQIAHALQTGGEAGMVPLARSLAGRVHAGLVARAVAAEHTDDADSLQQYLRR